MLTALKLYGIPNCNTVKKARVWLECHAIAYEFHDFKKHGVSVQLLENWLTQVPHEKLINRAGLTWRGLDDSVKINIVNNPSAIALMQAKTSVIKRPILEKDNTIVALGFNEAEYVEKLISPK